MTTEPGRVDPFDQARYQVRFGWGVDGLRRLAPADVVVLVDVLGLSVTVTDAAARGDRVALDDPAVTAGARRVCETAMRSDAVVLVGGIRNVAAVAAAVLDVQTERGARTSIAIVAVSASDAPGGFDVADLLGAGAVIAALGDLGIDHVSPEAVVAGEAYRGLGRATRHLLSASGAGQALDPDVRADAVRRAAASDDVVAVAQLRDGVFASR